MKTYKFIKTANEWYIDLPEYLEQGGLKADLQMVEGADKMLDIIAGNENSVMIALSLVPFDNADELILKEKCDPAIGGGYYTMQQYRGQLLNLDMWLCQVTEFVFGDIPKRIFLKKEE